MLNVIAQFVTDYPLLGQFAGSLLGGMIGAAVALVRLYGDVRELKAKVEILINNQKEA